MKERETDRTHVERCLHGDMEAFAPLIERYQRPVFNGILQMVGDYQDASELSQQVFMKAFQNLASYDQDRNFFSWIYRVAMNEALNRIKTRRQWEPISDDLVHPQQGAEERLEREERTRAVKRAVRSLQPKYRAVVVIRHFLHLSYAEAAEILGIPEKTVKSRLFDARQLLRDALTAKGFAERSTR